MYAPETLEFIYRLLAKSRDLKCMHCVSPGSKPSSSRCILKKSCSLSGIDECEKSADPFYVLWQNCMGGQLRNMHDFYHACSVMEVIHPYEVLTFIICVLTLIICLLAHRHCSLTIGMFELVEIFNI